LFLLFSIFLIMAKGKKNTGRKSTGGTAPRKVLFDDVPAGTDTTIDADMSSALTERAPTTQVSLSFV
jgi:hypothetical protein